MVGMSNGKVFSIDLSTFIKEQEFTIQGEIVGFRAASGEGVFILASFSSDSEIHLLDADSDDDGVVDGLDVFPEDPTEWVDSDGDGVGDNTDEFPQDASEISDSDGDSVGDNQDAFPDNPSQQTDSDGDGYGDYEYGQDGDKFPDDASQWFDTDGDGLGDFAEVRTYKTNPLSTDSDGDGLPDDVELREGFDPLVGTEAADGAFTVHTAIELEFFTLKSQQYIIQSSTDLENWEDETDTFQGKGGFYSIFASTREKQYSFWRLKVVE